MSDQAKETPSTDVPAVEMPPGAFMRNDMMVIVFAVAVLAGGLFVYQFITTPALVSDSHAGLRVSRPAAWLPFQKVPRVPQNLALAVEPGGDPTAPEPAAAPPPPEMVNQITQSPIAPLDRIEIRVEPRPVFRNWRGALSLFRVSRYGDTYWTAASSATGINGREWIRTRFRYAYVAYAGDSPRVATGIVYATLLSERLYVVTFHGDETSAPALAELLAPTLNIDAKQARPGEMTMRRLALALLCVLAAAPTPAAAEQQDKTIFKTTAPTVVMVLAVNVENGDLIPIASGSGTLISRDGSILTNHHVIFDPKANRPHDLFVIGRFQSMQREPELICAGRPRHGLLQPLLDLALLKCEFSVRGEPWPETVWPALPVGRSEELTPGERVWVFGYPSVGGSLLQISAGLITGFTGENGGAGSRAFMKTDAAISHGNSGGTAIDGDGRLIGVPTAFRVTTERSGTRIASIGKVGLVRPIEYARDLIMQARRGWVPGAGSELRLGQGAAPVPPADTLVTSRLIDNFNRAPVVSAFVIILKPGHHATEVEAGKLSEAALAWGQTNERGEFTLNAPLTRGRYSVVIMARGYVPMAIDNALTISETTPHTFDPWTELRLYRQRD